MTSAEHIKNLWVEALRSGAYQQGSGCLRSQYNSYCCLGVLCDVVIKNNLFDDPDVKWTDIEGINDYKTYSINNNSATMPDIIRKKIGFKTEIGSFFDKKLQKRVSLVFYNDNFRKNFSEIADLIEENWKELFNDT